MDINDLQEQIFLLELITDDGRINPNNNKIFKHHIDILGHINEHTSFLNDSAPIKERLICILMGLKQIPMCIECGENVKFNNNKKRYNEFCTSKCSYKSPHRNNKIKNTLINR